MSITDTSVVPPLRPLSWPPLKGMSGSSVPWISRIDTGRLGWHVGANSVPMVPATGAMARMRSASAQPRRWDMKAPVESPDANTRPVSMA